VARIIRAAQLCVNPPSALFLPAFSNAYAAGPTDAGALSIKPNFGAKRDWSGARCVPAWRLWISLISQPQSGWLRGGRV
jgi:hypothetical protein